MASPIATPPAAPPRAGGPARVARRRAILDLVTARAVGSQEELPASSGPAASPSPRDRAPRHRRPGLVKAARGDRHAYLTRGPSPARRARPTTPGPGRHGAGHPQPGDARLLRILADYPVAIARSG